MRRLALVLLIAAFTACDGTPTTVSAPPPPPPPVPAPPPPPPPQPPPPPPPGPPGSFVEIGGLGNHIMGIALNDSGVVVGAANAQPFAAVSGEIRILTAGQGRAGAVSASGATASVILLPHSRELRIWSAPRAEAVQVESLPNIDDLTVRGMNSRSDILLTDSLDGWDKRVSPVTRRDSAIDMASFVFRDGVLQSLGALHPYYRTTLAAGLNEQGQVVGRTAFGHLYSSDTPYYEGQLVYHPFLWQDGVMKDLGVLGQSGSECTTTAAPHTCARGGALAINRDGWIVGYSEDDAMVRRPVLWRNGIVSDLGPFPGTPATARLINDRGQIAGDNDHDALVWDNGTITVIGSLNGIALRVTAMNDRGDVAGTAMSPIGEQHAFVWRNGQLIDLGIPLGLGCAAQPVDINQHGDVLIAILTDFCGPQSDTPLTSMGYIYEQRAVVWHPPQP